MSLDAEMKDCGMWEREAASGSHVLPRPPPTHRPSSTAEACSGRSSFATMSQREAGPMIDDAGAARGMGRRQFLQATVASALVGIAARSPLLPRAIRTFDASRRGLPPSAAIQQLVDGQRLEIAQRFVGRLRDRPYDPAHGEDDEATSQCALLGAVPVGDHGPSRRHRLSGFP